METPYRKVVDKKLTDEIEYLTADQEADVMISIATVTVDENNMITDENVPAMIPAIIGNANSLIEVTPMM